MVYISGNYVGDILVPMWVVETYPQMGSADDWSVMVINDPEVRLELDKILPEKVATELRDLGAWEEDELANHEDNLKRLVWVLVGNYTDSMYE